MEIYVSRVYAFTFERIGNTGKTTIQKIVIAPNMDDAIDIIRNSHYGTLVGISQIADSFLIDRKYGDEMQPMKYADGKQ